MTTAAAADAVTMTVTHAGGTRVYTWRGTSPADVFARAETAWNKAEPDLRGTFPTAPRRELDGTFAAGFLVWSAE